MSGWKQHLFSKRVFLGHVGGFHVLTTQSPGDYEFTKRILDLKAPARGNSIAFLLDAGERIFIGVNGYISGVLGKDSPFAYEDAAKDRELVFVHGYFAPKGTKIPDIDELLKEQPKHLEEILRRANSGEAPVIAEVVHFSDSRRASTAWDDTATQVEHGKCPHNGGTFTTDGKLYRVLDKSSTSVAQDAPSAQKKTFSPKKMGAISFQKGCAVALGALIIGIAAWKLFEAFRHDTVRQEQRR